jgi:hypothetical protein
MDAVALVKSPSTRGAAELDEEGTGFSTWKYSDMALCG